MFLRILTLWLIPVLISNRSVGQRAVDTSLIINIGGIQQFVHVKGKDDSKPLLLFLHGGPGGSLMHKNDQMTGQLQKHFRVVQWDQRETGQTKRFNTTNQPLTLELFYRDTHDLIDSLLKEYNQPKLYLAGYSWGSGLGFHIAGKYPELLYAYIAISPVIDQRRSDSLSLSMLRETMGKEARKELSGVNIPFENAGQLYYHRKWLLKYDDQKLVFITLRKSIVESWGGTWFNVWSEACEVNLFKSLPAINCPVYFFAGENDHNTSALITTEYFIALSAPKKSLFLFEDAGHGVPETHAGEFQDYIISVILPETFPANK